jgi:hypothetical protein
MKIELLKVRTLDGKRHAAGEQIIVKKDEGLRLIETGAAVELVKTQTRLVEGGKTRQRFGPERHANHEVL